MPFGGHGASGCKRITTFVFYLVADVGGFVVVEKKTDGGYLGKSSYDQFTHLRSFINVPAEYVI